MRELDQWEELCEWTINRGTRRVCRGEAPAHLRHLFNRTKVRRSEAKVVMVRENEAFKVRKDWRERLEALKNGRAIFGSVEIRKV